jgi:hypothetical protein
MTDETVARIMKEKGFREWAGWKAFYKDDNPSGFSLYVEKHLDADIWCVSAQRGVEFVDAKIPFTSPIAAATYANRVVIPALLAGKENQ